MDPDAPAADLPWMALVRHPAFRAAAWENARRILEHKDSLAPAARWLTADLGRVAVLSRALMEQARVGAVTEARLQEITRLRRTSSAGRVRQILRRAQAVGWIETAPGSGGGRAGPLLLKPAFKDAWRARARIEIETAGRLFPQICPALGPLDDDQAFAAYLARLADFDAMPPPARGPANPGIRFFLQHDCGLLILHDLFVRQPEDRERFLDAAPLSRIALARRHRVSRSHVAGLVEAAAAAGHLSLEGTGRIRFSPALSQEAERHFALTFEVSRLCALAVMDAAPRAAA